MPPPPLRAELIASMQFEFISCFRWSLANQGRHEAQVGAIKLTTPAPRLFKKGKNKAGTRRHPPTPTSSSLGKPRAAAWLSSKSCHPPGRHPTCQQCPFVAAYLTPPHRAPFLCACHDLVNKEETQALRGREGSGLDRRKEGPTHLKWVHVILPETKDESC